MAGVRRFEHSQLRVKNLQESTRFCTQVMGLVEISRQNGVSYLGCGLDRNFDLALSEGGTGLDHFAMRVDGENELEIYKKRLMKYNVKFGDKRNLEPCIKSAISFKLPSGIPMELVTVEDNTYQRVNVPAYNLRSPIAPLDADHMSILVPDVLAETNFLCDVLGFKISDIIQAPNTNQWMIAFLRMGILKNDIVINGGQLAQISNARQLHHLAWTMSNSEHMKFLIDRINWSGTPLEYGPARQGVGNISAYFWEPGGNRFEISTEMPTLNSDTRTKFIVPGFDKTASWGSPARASTGS